MEKQSRFTPECSIIILLEEERVGFDQFLKDIVKVFSDHGPPFEILIMANGTGGFLKDRLRNLKALNHRIKAFEFFNRTTHAVCLNAALEESSGEVILVCGDYEQIPNESLVELVRALDEETDIVSPWRHPRIDSRLNQWQSSLFNALIRWMTKSEWHDLGCIVKVVRREVLQNAPLYGQMYRFLPIIAARKGFKTKEIKCRHIREYGKAGFYSLRKYVTTLIDIFTLYFTTRFTRKPLRFFSAIGLLFMVGGFLTAASVFIQKIFMGLPVGNRPILFLAILIMVLGILVASVGLLGEIIVFTHSRKKREYTIEKEI